jgi:catechol 2,3-dioxygenase-like lactoylglutathione lyase family enzyme
MAVDLDFDHLGLAVRDPETSRRTLRALGYEIGHTVFDEHQCSYVQLCTSDHLPAVEIVYSDHPDSPLNAVLSDRDEGVYHVCYRTPSIAAAVEAIRGTGQRVMCVREASSAPLFDGRLVAFYYVRGLGLVELLEDSPKLRTAS